MKRSHSNEDLELARKRLKTLQESFTDLNEIASCLVCFGHLPDYAVSCVNGHAVFVTCGNKLAECPTCKDSDTLLSPHTHTLLRKLLEGLPRICKHDRCDFATKEVDGITEHENFCEDRRTKCRINRCSWVGRVKDVLGHVENEHPNRLLLPSNATERYFNDFANLENVTANYFHLVDGVIFWRTTHIDRAEKAVTVKVVCVPTADIKDTYQLEVKLGSNKHKGKTNLKLFSDEVAVEDNVLNFDYDSF